MFSLKRKTDPSEQDGAHQIEELIPAVSALLRAIEQNTPAYDPSGENFRRSMEHLQDQVEQTQDSQTVVGLIRQAVGALEEHHAGFLKFLATRRREVRSLLMLLIETVLNLASKKEAVARELRLLSGEVEQSLEVDTIHALTDRIALSLLALRDVPQEPSGGATAGEARTLAQGEAGLNGLDATTGLATAERAKQSIVTAQQSERGYYVAVFAIERLEVVNSRFGFAAGDQMLMLLSQHIAQQLSGGDQLFRWRGPTLMALLQRDQPQRLIEAEVLKIASSRLEYTISSRDRDVMLRIICSHCVFPLAREAKIETVTGRIDAFSTDRTYGAWR
jgi:GGDEF domain-containing protein